MAKAKPKRSWLRWGLSGLLVIWAFVLGVMVGQGTLASDQQLDSLRKLSLSWFGINFSKEDSVQNPLRDPELSFYDQLTSNQQGRPNSQPSQPSQPTQSSQPNQPSQPSPASPAEQPASSPPPLTPTQSGQPTPPTQPTQPGQNGGNTTSTASPPQSVPLNQVRPYQPDNAPVPNVSSQPGSAATGRFTVQVGSFKDERQAQELANRLKRNGFPAYISKVEISGAGVRLRVRVGGYESLDQAQNVATNLRLKENVGAYVTRNE